MTLTYLPYDPDWVASIRAGGPDAYGLPAERTVSDGGGNPCRHCLRDIPKGAEMLIVAARPFTNLQPYAETGPIFLCGDDCAPYQGDGMPPVLARRERTLLKAYSADERIIYGTGQITPTDEIEAYVEALLTDPKVAYADARSATNNCFTLRIMRLI